MGHIIKASSAIKDRGILSVYIYTVSQYDENILQSISEYFMLTILVTSVT